MVNLRKAIKNSNKPVEGQGMVEYALLLFLVAVAVMAVLILLGPEIGNVFSQVSNNLGGAAATPGTGEFCKPGLDC